MTLALALRLGPWLAILALIGALAIQTDRVKDWRQTAEHCSQARKADRTEYEKAQAQSKANNLAHVRKVESEQRAKTDAVESRWNADRARLAELMRRPRNPAAPGGAGPTSTPADGAAAEGSDGARVCLPEEDAMSAARNELRLFYLQEWIRAQLKVPLNPS